MATRIILKLLFEDLLRDLVTFGTINLLTSLKKSAKAVLHILKLKVRHFKGPNLGCREDGEAAADTPAAS